MKLRTLLLSLILLSLIGCQSTPKRPTPRTYAMADGSMMVDFVHNPHPSYSDEQVVDGRGELKWPTSDLYERISYKGDIQSALAHGQGVFIWHGRQYEGALKWGQPHGEGVMTFADGRKLTGNWRYGFHSKSGWHPRRLDTSRARLKGNVLSWPDGSIYRGALRNGKPHGKGLMRWSNGDTYDGMWVNGQRQGEGVQINADGSRYAGSWRSDREDGMGRADYPSILPGEEKINGFYRGSWKQGMPNGAGERDWSQYAFPVIAAGPFSPDADMLHHARSKWWLERPPDGHRLGDSYEGHWLDGDWHGPGRFYMGSSYKIYILEADFAHGWPKDRVQVWAGYKSENELNHWDFGVSGKKRHGKYLFLTAKKNEYTYTYDNGNKTHEHFRSLGPKTKKKSFMPGLVAGALMGVAATSVGADSATALKAATAFGSDVQNNTTHNSQAFNQSMEARYIQLKRENDAYTKSLVDKAWRNIRPIEGSQANSQAGTASKPVENQQTVANSSTAKPSPPALQATQAGWTDNKSLVGNWVFSQCDGQKDFRIEFSSGGTSDGFNIGKMYRPDCNGICGDTEYDVKWKVEGNSLLIYNTYKRLCIGHPDFAWEGPDDKGGSSSFSLKGNELRINSTTYRRR